MQGLDRCHFPQFKRDALAVLLMILALLSSCRKKSDISGSYVVSIAFADDNIHMDDVRGVGPTTVASPEIRTRVNEIALPIAKEQLAQANVRSGTATLEIQVLGSDPVFVSKRNLQIVTPNIRELFSAVEVGDTDRIRAFVAHWNSVNQRELPSLRTGLFTAAAANRDLSMKTLIELHANPNIPDFEGDTPLSAAVTANCTKCVELLLDHGANVNQANSLGITPLMKASLLSRIDEIKILLKRGANTSLKANSGESALQLAEEAHNSSAAALLRRSVEQP